MALIEHYAVVFENVTKVYRKWDRSKNFLTLKSALLRGELFSALKNKEKGFYALKNISFKVKKGTTLGIIGRNGSGKSTLLKLLAGITKPADGTIRTNGKITALLELGAGFHPEISGRENIFINGIMLGLTKKELMEKYNEIVSFSELEDFIEAPVKTYSSGMYMRLAFSIAINVNPDILLIDEILAVGDKSFTGKCIERINQLKSQGKTIIFVSHNLQTVESLCNEVIWLEKGELLSIGRPHEIIESYLLKTAEDEEKKINTIQNKEAQDLHDNKKIRTYQQKHKGPDRKYPVDIIAGPDETNPFTRKRWGSRQIEIKKVEILGQDGRTRWVIKTGEDIIFRLHYLSEKEEVNPVIGIGIYRIDDLCIFATNTQIEKKELQPLGNSGHIDIFVKNLNLMPNIYFLDMALHNTDGFPYDYHYRLYRFKVYSNIDDLGIYRFNHDWKVFRASDEQ